MKKLLILELAILLIAGLVLVACNKLEDEPKKLWTDAEIEEQIIKDYYKYLKYPDAGEGPTELVHILRRFGNIKGCYVVQYGGIYSTADIRSIYVNQIHFNNAAPVLAWKENKTYSLEQAFNLGLLDGNDVQYIADAINGGFK